MQGLVFAITALVALSVSAISAVPVVLSARQVAQPAPAAPPPPPPVIPEPYEAPHTTFNVPLDSVVRIMCYRDYGPVRGTASVINGNTLFTASHVIKGASKCEIDDGSKELAHIVYDRNDMDYATLYSKTGKKQRVPINCDGFITGQTYMMVGYAGGVHFVVQTAIATKEYSNRRDWKSGQPFTHVRTLKGVVDGRPSAIGGMSGGPIFNLRGEMVGITVATNKNADSPLGYAREMKDTYVCQPRTTPPSE